MREAWAGFLIAVASAVALAGSPASAVLAARDDAKKLPADAAANAGYLWFGSVPVADRPVLAALVRHGLNQVSTDVHIAQVTLVGTEVLRFDRRDPGPAFAGVWEKTADFDTIFHLQTTVEEAVEEEVDLGHYEDAYGRRLDGWQSGQPAPDGGHWVKTGTTKQKVKKAGKVKKGVMAAEHIIDCPTCQGWLPTQATAELLAMTQSRSPVLDAQWFWAHTARQLSIDNVDQGIGYYNWQGIKTRDDFFRILHVHNDDDVHVFRGVFTPGQALNQNGRGVEGIDALFGKRWVTLDPNSTDDARNVTLNLRRGELLHDAEEHIGPGPNGIEKDLLCTDKGVLQPSAPDFISSISGPNYGGSDNRIHIWLGCKECHADKVLLPLDHEWARKTFTGGPGKPGPVLQSPDYNTDRDFQDQLFSNIEKERLKAAAGMIEATEQVSGMKMAAFCKATSDEWRAYANTPLDAEAVGRLHGVDGKTVLLAVKAHYDANPVTGVVPPLAPFLNAKGTISRQDAEAFYYTLETYLQEFR